MMPGMKAITCSRSIHSACPKPRAWFTAIFLCHICVACWCSNAAAQNSATNKTVWQKDYEYVSIVSNDGRPGGYHPVNISPRSLRRALLSLRIKPTSRIFTGGNKVVPLFSEKSATLLAKLLASSLRRAESEQDVLFRIGQESAFVGNLFSRTRYTAGRVFWYKKRLHIIFGGIHRAVKKRTVYGQEQTARLIGEPGKGSRGNETELDFEVVPSPGVSYATRKRRDWIAVRPDKIRARSVAGSRGSDIETRMRKLKRLFDKGLIDEREYRARKRELLDEL